MTGSDPKRLPHGSEEGFPAYPLDDQTLNAEELEQAYLLALETLEATEHLPGMEIEESEDPESGEEGSDGSGVSRDPSTEILFEEDEEIEEGRRISPSQIIEAVLFVGGQPLTAKKIASLFDAHVDHFLIEAQIETLNEEYRSQNRPYEIRLGEGGYRLMLRPEFEGIRNRVYGIGPREVRLSQDCLEVLAFVAYRQPVSHQQLLESGKKNSTNLVRQLIRRELVIIERGENGPKSVAYKTTSRFLSLFGLSSLEELPQADDLTIR